MTAETFAQIVRERCDAVKKTLLHKASEYATEDRLHNFKQSAADFGGTAMFICWNFLIKHLTSIGDMASERKPITQAAIDEKIGDAIAYLMLLEALFLEVCSD